MTEAVRVAARDAALHVDARLTTQGRPTPCWGSVLPGWAGTAVVPEHPQHPKLWDEQGAEPILRAWGGGGDTWSFRYLKQMSNASH